MYGLFYSVATVPGSCDCSVPLKVLQKELMHWSTFKVSLRPGKKRDHGFTAWFTGLSWSHSFLKVCRNFMVLHFYPHEHKNRQFVNTHLRKKKKKHMFHVENTVHKLRRVSLEQPSRKIPLVQCHANALLLLISAPFSIEIFTTTRSLCRSFGSCLDFWSR